MLKNPSIAYKNDILHCDDIALTDIAAQQETPLYVYSLPRALENLRRIQTAFAELQPHIHYSAKANANLTLLRALIQARVGIDAVSAGEIHRALVAGAKPEDIVFAGVGKSPEELRYALEQRVGWFNVENIEEVSMLNQLAGELGTRARIALRLNPEIAADTHPHIATGHGKAKFGLTAEDIQHLLSQQTHFVHLDFAGIHVHIGSQLHSTDATQAAVQSALRLIASYPQMRSVNVGGGLPVAYHPDEALPPFEHFAQSITPLLRGYDVMLEPGRSIIADAGLLLTRVLYVKRHAGQVFVICDASMSELIRPALYEAHHEIVPVKRTDTKVERVTVVGPVCETTDVLGREVDIPTVQPGDLLAVLTAGAYGMVMSSNYNQRPRPAEIVVAEDGKSWSIARRRETWADMLQTEQ